MLDYLLSEASAGNPLVLIGALVVFVVVLWISGLGRLIWLFVLVVYVPFIVFGLLLGSGGLIAVWLSH